MLLLIINLKDFSLYHLQEHKTESLAKLTIKKEKAKAEEQIRGHFSNLSKLHDSVLSPLLLTNYTMPPVDIMKDGIKNSKRFFQLKKSRYGALIEPKCRGKSRVVDRKNKSSKAHLADLRKYVLKKESQKLVGSIKADNARPSVEQVKQVNGDGVLEPPLEDPVTKPHANFIKICSNPLDIEGETALKKIDCKLPKIEGLAINRAGAKRRCPDEFKIEASGKGCKRLKKISKAEHLLLKEGEKTKRALTQSQNSRKRKLPPVDGKSEKKKAKLLYS